MADVKAYADTLLKSAKNATDAQKEAFLALIADEGVNKQLDETLNGMMLKADFDRESGRVKKRESEINAYYQQQLELATSNQEVVNKAQADLKRYVDAYGTLPDGTAPTRANTEEFVSKKVMEEELKKRETPTLYLIKRATALQADHLHRFNEPLDMDALEKTAVENKISIDDAYTRMTKPRLDAKQNTEFDAKLKAAREEGLKEGLSRSGLPVDAKPKEPSAFRQNMLHKPDKPPTVSESFVSSWNEATATRQ